MNLLQICYWIKKLIPMPRLNMARPLCICYVVLGVFATKTLMKWNQKSSKDSEKSIDLKEDARRMRPSDVPILEGDATKFREVTGWEPTISFEKTLEDILQYWRERV